MAEANTKSWWSRLFGRSILEMVLGVKFFERKANAASLIAIILVLTVCYVVVFGDGQKHMDALLNILFMVIGYYFGAKQTKVDKDEDERP